MVDRLVVRPEPRNNPADDAYNLDEWTLLFLDKPLFRSSIYSSCSDGNRKRCHAHCCCNDGDVCSTMSTVPLSIRLSSNIDWLAPNGCWTWRGTRNQFGYGQVWFKGKFHTVHRLVYRLLVGFIPKKLTLDHICRNRPCCNPSHLEPVTLRENILRGESPCARHARQTHCAKGHALSLDNLAKCELPYRRCLACRTEKNRRLYLNRRRKIQNG